MAALWGGRFTEAADDRFKKFNAKLIFCSYPQSKVFPFWELAKQKGITYIDFEGTERSVDGKVGDSVMETATSNDLPGIDADCGGAWARCGPPWSAQFPGDALGVRPSASSRRLVDW